MPCSTCKHYQRDGERAWWGDCTIRVVPAGMSDKDADAFRSTTDGDTCRAYEADVAKMAVEHQREMSAVLWECEG